MRPRPPASLPRWSAALLFVLGCTHASPPPAKPEQPAPPAPPTRAEILTDSDLPAPLAKPLPDDQLGVTIHQLSNGMTVYLCPDPDAARVTAWIAVRAGSRNDPPGSTGLASLVTRMMFAGTSRIGTTDFAAEQPHLDKLAELYQKLRRAKGADARADLLAQIDQTSQEAGRYAIPNELQHIYFALGARGVTALTSVDRTIYAADLPRGRIAAWARIEAERFSFPAFRLYSSELRATYQEKNQALSHPAMLLDAALLRALYPEHPYGTRPVLGTVEDLERPDYQAMADFFRRWYVPNNMAIVLAGDVDQHVLPTLDEAFGQLEPRPLPPPPEELPPPLTGRVEFDIDAPDYEAVAVAWRTVPADHPDRPALEVMDLLLRDPRSGMIEADPVLPYRLARAWTEAAYYHEAGHFALFGLVRAGHTLDEAEKLLLGLADKLKRGGFSQAELDAVVLRAEMSEMSRLEGDQARAAEMADAFLDHQPWTEVAAHTARLRAVTTDDVLRVANKYLGKDFAVVRRHRGKAPAPMEMPPVTAPPESPPRKSHFAEEIAAMPAPPPRAPHWLKAGTDYQRVVLPSGPLIAVANRRSQLFSLRYDFDLDRHRDPLLCLALSVWDRSGKADDSAGAVQARLLELGTTVTTDCSDDSASITISGIDRNLQPSVALVAGWLHQATLDPKFLAARVTQRIDQRKHDKQSIGTLSWALEQYATLGKDSRYLNAPGDRTLRSATAAALTELLADLADRNHRTDYFGPRPAEKVAAVVELSDQPHPAPAPRPITYRRTRGVRIFLAQAAIPNARVTVVLPQSAATPAETPLFELYASYVTARLGEQSGDTPVYPALHFASVQFVPGSRAGDQTTLRSNFTVATDQTAAALSQLLGVLRAPPIRADALEATRTELLDRYRSTRPLPRFVASLVKLWDQQGLEGDPRAGYFAAHQKVTTDDLARAAKRFAGGDVIISIVGDRAHLDLRALRKLGKVQIVKPSKLFDY